jgi:hypothetical protein
VAIEGNFASYEYILEGLFRLQIGFDKGRVETGILMLTSERSEKSSVNRHPKLTHYRRPKLTHQWFIGLIPVGPHGGPTGG